MHLNKETIFWVFRMIRPGIEPQSPGPLANTLTARPMDRLIGLMSRVFTNGPGSIPGRVIPKTQKMVLDTTWLNTQHYKAKIKGSGIIQEWVSTLPDTSV